MPPCQSQYGKGKPAAPYIKNQRKKKQHHTRRGTAYGEMHAHVRICSHQAGVGDELLLFPVFLLVCTKKWKSFCFFVPFIRFSSHEPNANSTTASCQRLEFIKVSVAAPEKKGTTSIKQARRSGRASSAPPWPFTNAQANQ